MEKYTRRYQPCARAMIIYLSGSSSPTLPITASMAQEMDTQETWSPAYRALPLPQRHPGIRFGVPMGCYVAHAIVWRRRVAFLAMEQAHSGAVSARQTRPLCRCFVQAKWRSSKKAKTSAFRSSKQGVVIFLLLRF